MDHPVVVISDHTGRDPYFVLKQIAGSIITQIFEYPWDSPTSKTNRLTIKKLVIMGLWKRKFHSVSVLGDPNLKILSYSSIGLLDVNKFLNGSTFRIYSIFLS